MTLWMRVLARTRLHGLSLFCLGTHVVLWAVKVSDEKQSGAPLAPKYQRQRRATAVSIRLLVSPATRSPLITSCIMYCRRYADISKQLDAQQRDHVREKGCNAVNNAFRFKHRAYDHHHDPYPVCTLASNCAVTLLKDRWWLCCQMVCIIHLYISTGSEGA